MGLNLKKTVSSSRDTKVVKSLLHKSKNLVSGLCPSASEKCVFLNQVFRKNKQQSLFTRRHGDHIGVPKQWNGGHVGVPN